MRNVILNYIKFMTQWKTFIDDKMIKFIEGIVKQEVFKLRLLPYKTKQK